LSFHLALAARRAISFFRSAVKLSALALPPFIPPLRPIVAKYSEIAFMLSDNGAGSSVASFTVKGAAEPGSDGILLKRFMHTVSRLTLNSASVSGSSKISRYPSVALVARRDASLYYRDSLSSG